MRRVSGEHGLRQIVNVPTRGDYLLDLVLTNHIDVKYSLGPKISDHFSLLINLPDSMEDREMSSRTIWHYRDANWQAIRETLQSFDVRQLTHGSVNDACNLFDQFLRGLMHSYVPQSARQSVKSTLPWLNDKCRSIIALKHSSESTPQYNQIATKCQQMLHQEKQKYIFRLKS